MSGGLGNQLFQYSAARSVALRLGTGVTIDTRFYPLAAQGGAKGFWLAHFPIRADIVSYEASLIPPHHILRRVYRALVSEPRAKRFYEPRLGYNSSIWDVKDGAILIGNFQSPMYFSRYYEILADEIDLLRVGTIPPTKKINELPMSEFIGVHVRRGDYLSLPDFDMVDRDTYYTRALSIISEKNGKSRPLLVVSDDIAWCKTRPCFQGAVFVESEPSSPPYNDLFLLSQCGALVIANSSFSWWAGWFASLRGALVIAPRVWLFGESSGALSITPSNWLLV